MTEIKFDQNDEGGTLEHTFQISSFLSFLMFNFTSYALNLTSYIMKFSISCGTTFKKLKQKTSFKIINLSHQNDISNAF